MKKKETYINANYEVLTQKGQWVTLTDITTEDYILTYNIASQKSEFRSVDSKENDNYSGPFLSMIGDNYNSSFIPNTRIGYLHHIYSRVMGDTIKDIVNYYTKDNLYPITTTKSGSASNLSDNDKLNIFFMIYNLIGKLDIVKANDLTITCKISIDERAKVSTLIRYLNKQKWDYTLVEKQPTDFIKTYGVFVIEIPNDFVIPQNITEWCINPMYNHKWYKAVISEIFRWVGLSTYDVNNRYIVEGTLVYKNKVLLDLVSTLAVVSGYAVSKLNYSTGELILSSRYKYATNIDIIEKEAQDLPVVSITTDNMFYIVRTGMNIVLVN